MNEIIVKTLAKTIVVLIGVTAAKIAITQGVEKGFSNVLEKEHERIINEWKIERDFKENGTISE